MIAFLGSLSATFSCEAASANTHTSPNLENPAIKQLHYIKPNTEPGKVFSVPEPEVCEVCGCDGTIHIACGCCGMALCGTHADSMYCGADFGHRCEDRSKDHWFNRKAGVFRRIVRAGDHYVSLVDLK